ncbi:histidine--tRNA ligase [Candidatus Woesearchaeota archaeon]|nr:histidine--tRNA ligase [Candidatus Woesearchaeota archaeon]
MTLQNAPGTRDFPAEQAIARQRLTNVLRGVFELYGYNPLETPVLERFDVLASKYAGGAEILKETFKVNDQGKRQLSLRYDLTVPMCRFIAMNPNMKLPFKRYQIGEVFRDGPIKLGRYRQFTQCDVDVVGVKGMSADAEIACIAQFAFAELGLPATIKLNSRKVLNGILETAGVRKEKMETAILSIDKLEKIGRNGVEKELNEKRIPKQSITRIMELTSATGTNQARIDQLRFSLKSDQGIEGMNEVESLISFIPDSSNIEFSPSLARGLAYYTGTVIEAFLTGSEIKSAVAAGGRYDKMIGNFLGTGKEYPAVGVSFGLDVILDALQIAGLRQKKAVSVAYIIPIKAFKEASSIAQKLRNAGIKAGIDLMERGISRNLEYAASAGIQYAVIVGEQEMKQARVKLRNMQTGEEKLATVEEAISILASHTPSYPKSNKNTG